MNSYWKRFVVKTISYNAKSREVTHYSKYSLAKAFRDFKISVLRLLKDIVLIVLGIASAAFGLESFLLPNKFIDGGATGISLLASELGSIPLYILLLLVSHGERRDIDIIYSVITRLELHRLNTEITKIDPNAFVVMNSVKDTKGGMIKKRSLKH